MNTKRPLISIPEINLEEYLYKLPKERIAQKPLEKRDSSKLLVYREGKIMHRTFHEIDTELNAGDTVFFNNTKVIPARVLFRKETGAVIEIFLMNPVSPSTEVSEVMQENESCVWACMVGNLKRFKDDTVLERRLEIQGKTVVLRAELHSREKQEVRLSWRNNENRFSFAEVIEKLGQTPLPPYIHRELELNDKERYQTVYSRESGAVAAPTAGLHFTNDVKDSFRKKGIQTDYLTLHVAGGTFQPIKDGNVLKHPMHAEQLIVSRDNLQTLANSERIIATGTTSMRTLESLYYYAVLLRENPEAPFRVPKLAPYFRYETPLPSRREAAELLLRKLDESGRNILTGETEIFIFPGYEFKVCDGLITNFHMPSTTLVLLVAAFVGEDWRRIYEAALSEDYRFLSYGDSSLLFRS